MSYYAVLDEIPCRAPCNRYNIFTFGVISETQNPTGSKGPIGLTDIIKNPYPSSTPYSSSNQISRMMPPGFEGYKNLSGPDGPKSCNCSIYNIPESDPNGYNRSLTWKDQEYYRKKIQNNPLV